MNRLLALAVTLGTVGICTGAAAQQPLAPTLPGQQIVTVPMVISSGQVLDGRTQTQAAVQTATVQPAEAEPAPYKPAPLGTYIETTADKRLIIGKNGYNTIYTVNGRRELSFALLTDGFGGEQVYPPQALESFWPLSVGKDVTFNIGAGNPSSVNLRVLRTETITVPAGTFYTYVIQRRSHGVSSSTEDVATYWYAPSVGTMVKFSEQRAYGRSRPAFEATQIVLPHPLNGVIPVTTPGDTPERRAQFCTQTGTTLHLANGQSIVVPCVTYIQADLGAYQRWLSANGNAAANVMSSTEANASGYPAH